MPVTLGGDGDDVYRFETIEVLDRILTTPGSVLAARTVTVDTRSLVDFSEGGSAFTSDGKAYSADIIYLTLDDNGYDTAPFAADPGGPYRSRGDGGLLVLGDNDILVRVLNNPDAGGADPMARVFGTGELLYLSRPASKPSDSASAPPSLQPVPPATETAPAPAPAPAKSFADAYQAQAARLYDTVFDRAGDAGGLEFWTNHLRAGVPLVAVADGFTGAPEFAARYGTPDDREFTGLLYRNVLDREAEPEGLAFWSGLLSEFTASRAQVVVGFSESAEHVALITADRALV